MKIVRFRKVTMRIATIMLTIVHTLNIDRAIHTNTMNIDNIAQY